MRGLLVACLALAACDSKASSNDGGGGKPEQKSKEYESCGASMHCADELRCFDHACRRTARSNTGDYYAALGAQARARGELDAAINAYTSAVGNYDGAKIPLPPDIDCAYGGALAAAKANQEHARLAARVLHRCLLAPPAGTNLRDRALADLATLDDRGLDPVLLGANKVSDVYLTKGPRAPATDKLAVTVTGNPTPTGKQWPKIPDKLSAPDVKPALVQCWTQYNGATKKTELVANIGLKVGFYSDPNYPDDEGGAWITKLDPPAAGAPAEEACVRAAIEPAIKGLKLSESISTKLQITIK
jgi:hypothetical protein